jgi:hypothetical protein
VTASQRYVLTASIVGFQHAGAEDFMQEKRVMAIMKLVNTQLPVSMVDASIIADYFITFADSPDERQSCAEVGLDAWSFRVVSSEYESIHALAVHLRQAELVPLEPFALTIGQSDSRQFAVQVVGPAVIHATKGVAVAAPVHYDGRRTMPAGIEINANLAVGIAAHDTRIAPQIDDPVIARVADLRLVPYVNPCAPEYSFLLQLKHCWICINVPVNQLCSAERFFDPGFLAPRNIHRILL